MSVTVTYNDPDEVATGAESVEFTFWFKLDGTRDADDVCDQILAVLETSFIDGVEYKTTFTSPFAKLYST